MRDLFKYHNHLGFHSPYYLTNEDGSYTFGRNNSEMLSKIQSKKIDIVAVIELLSTGFCFADRTLVKDINRSPWMAKPDPSNKKWIYTKVPRHDEKIMDHDKIVDSFYSLLRDELSSYIEEHSKIGILLTGGMDSRIVACVLNNLITELQLNKEVFAFTWGSLDSRDVVYAEKIANNFGWSWEHVEVDSSQMRVNMELVMEEGCEFTPVHLHAMAKVAKKTYLDCILAGSFGDSIGRGEYSGRKVSVLSNLKNSVKNVSSLFNQNIFYSSLEQVEYDLSSYHKQFPCDKSYQLFEQDQQIHYMRRMLNPCMNVIDRHIPLYQMFTAPEVFGFMWSLDPKLRSNQVYHDILKKYRPDLLEIPWSRTGLIYASKSGKPDGFKKSHHNYAKMIKEEFLTDIEDTIKKYELEEFNIFDIKIIGDLIKYCKSFEILGSIYYEERLLWLACFAKYLRVNNIEADFTDNFSCSSRLSAGKDYFSKYLYRRLTST